MIRRLSLALSIAALAALSLGPVRADDGPKKDDGLPAPKPADPPATQQTVYDWGVAYYMSYDNNLEGCGKPIIEMIKAGVTSPKTIACVQADFTDNDGMHRFVIKSTGTEETKVDTEDSALEQTAIDYLEWFAKTYKCKHYVVTFLDHGGKLDEMCFDENPGSSGKSWMSGRILGEKMRTKLKDAFGDKWDLFFLQQCGRGSIENLYSFRDTAKFIMSSPVPVGAPNTYYTALHKWLGETPDATGAEVAAKIMKEDEHYTIYTCLRTAKLAELPAKLDAALKPFLQKKELTAPDQPEAIHPVGEPIVDARTYLERLAKANGGDTATVDAFTKWMKEELFTKVSFQRRSARLKDRLCGLSIYAASNADEMRRYKKLDIYKSSKLMSLWQKILKEEPAEKKSSFK